MAGTVIDALVVTLGLDNSQFQRNSKQSQQSLDQFSDQAQSDAKNVMRATRQMTQGFRSIRNELVGMLAVSVGGYGAGNLIANTIGDQAQLGRLSEDLRMSARDLDAWGRVMRSVGGTADDARQSMTGITDAVQAFALGQDGSTVPYLRSLGIEVANERGTARAPQEILTDMAEAFQGLSATEQRNVAQQTGLTDRMMYLLRQGPEKLTSALQQARQASNVTPESVEQSQKAQQAFAELGNEINGIWQTLYVSATPAMEELNGTLGEFSDWLQDNRSEVEDFFTGLVDGGESVAGALSEFNEASDSAVAKIAAFSAAILLLGGASGLVGGKVLGSLGKAGLFGGLLYGGTEASNYLNDLINDSPLGPANRAVGESMDETKDAAGELVSRLYQAITGNPAMEATGGYKSARAGGASGNEEDMISWYMANGWNRAQAVGIVANLKAESALNPRAVGDNGQAYGLAQWHPDRQRNFQRWAGKSIRESSLEEQMAFVNHEMRFGQEKAAGRALMEAKTAEQAASVVARRYERPANADLQAMRRAEMAGTMYGETAGLMPLGATSRPGMREGGGGTTNTSEVNIGTMTVNTKATDAQGIGNDLREDLRRNSLIDAGTTGMH